MKQDAIGTTVITFIGATLGAGVAYDNSWMGTYYSCLVLSAVSLFAIILFVVCK